MAVSGIVITLDNDSIDRTTTLARLRALPHLTLADSLAESHRDLDDGPIWRQPAVLDSPTTAEDEACWDEILRVPGVAGLELVCVYFDEATPTEPPGTGVAQQHHVGPSR